MMRATHAMALAIAICAGACTGPTAPASGPSDPIPLPIVSLSGYVNNTAFAAVSDATVEVLDGEKAGLTLTTDADGRFSFDGKFENPVTIRVSKPRYITRTATTKRINNGRPFVGVLLEASDPPVNVSGAYSMTVVADSSCSGIPSEFRTRTYSATIAPNPEPSAPAGTAFLLTASGAPLLPNYEHINVGVAGNAVGFSLYASEDYGLVEQLEPTKFLAISGLATDSLTSPASKISTALRGDITYCATQTATGWNSDCSRGPRVVFFDCLSTNHQLILERR